MRIEYRPVKGHVEVYIDDMFLLSADTLSEAMREVENAKKKGA